MSADEYSPTDYGGMIADPVRMAAYGAALEAAVKPGAVVVDLGAGTGIMSLVACRLGARRVYAIEPGASIQVARELAAANGFGDRVTCIQERSERVELPERCDVLVADLRGVLPLYASHVPVLADARRRFLAPGGALIPRRDHLQVAVVAAEAAYDACRAPWRDGARGFDMTPAERLALQQMRRLRVPADEVLTPPRTWTTLDYETVSSASARGVASWTFEGRSIGRGLQLWFDAELAPGIAFSNAPGAAATLYQAMFAPWTQPVALEPGDEIAVELFADHLGEDYVWRWNTMVTGAGGGAPKAAFRQSTFLGQPITAEALRRRRPDHVPRLNDEGRLAAFVLGELRGERALGEIARDLTARFPAACPDEPSALARAASLARKYGD
jgi:protein arginine N-methyltransferase 1